MPRDGAGTPRPLQGGPRRGGVLVARDRDGAEVGKEAGHRRLEPDLQPFVAPLADTPPELLDGRRGRRRIRADRLPPCQHPVFMCAQVCRCTPVARPADGRRGTALRGRGRHGQAPRRRPALPRLARAVTTALADLPPPLPPVPAPRRPRAAGREGARGDAPPLPRLPPHVPAVQHLDRVGCSRGGPARVCGRAAAGNDRDARPSLPPTARANARAPRNQGDRPAGRHVHRDRAAPLPTPPGPVVDPGDTRRRQRAGCLPPPAPRPARRAPPRMCQGCPPTAAPAADAAPSPPRSARRRDAGGNRAAHGGSGEWSGWPAPGAAARACRRRRLDRHHRPGDGDPARRDPVY